MFFCMLKCYPIDTTTVPMWTYMVEMMFATYVMYSHVGTEMVLIIQHKGVHHFDLMVMHFMKYLHWLVMLALGRCMTGILGFECPIK